VDTLTTPKGVCVGLVADASTIGWKFPRKVLSYNNRLYVAAFGGWAKNRGQIWELDLTKKPLQARALFKGTDRTHGLRLGPKGKIYFGDASTIYRFDPNSPHPQKEAVITQLPSTYKLPDGKVIDSNHPLKEFLILPSGNLVVNIGAPTNDCSEEFKLSRDCAERDVQAELRLYYYDEATDSYDPRFTRLAKGLRNSMGLLYNPQTDELYQAENAADKPGTPDEVNTIDLQAVSQGKVYDFGWPFCSGNGERYDGYTNFKTFCATKADRPTFLLPPHVAPLDMMLYTGDLFPFLKGKILMSWHGWRDSGSRIAVFDTNDVGGFKNSTPGFLIQNWLKEPKGHPVGLAADPEGTIYVVDDQNHALLILSSSTGAPPTPPKNKNGDQNGAVGEKDLPRLFSPGQLTQWDRLFTGAIQKRNCQECHGDVVKESSSRKTLALMLNQGWLKKDGKTSWSEQTLWQRMTGSSGVRIMPPAPAANILDGKGRAGSDYENLKAWLQSL